jgi:hypothetical protein
MKSVSAKVEKILENVQKNSIFYKLFLYGIIIFSFIFNSCGNSSQKRKGMENCQNESSVVLDKVLNLAGKESVDIPIILNLAHTEDEEQKQFNPSEYQITKETDKDIFIDINSKYYKNYVSGKRFKVPRPNILYSEDVEYLTMELDIVNNTSTTLDIKELDIMVDESKEDRIPFVYISTSNDYSNAISFINGSWFNWSGFTFLYKILRKGETFDGTYNKRRHVPYFKTRKTIDLLPDMKDIGYDFDRVVECVRQYIEENGWDFNPIEYDNDGYFLGLGIPKDDENLDHYRKIFEPFELIENEFGQMDGIAKLYGSIQFDNSDIKIDFIADISLFGGDFGAASYENDHFDVKLKSKGSNYMLRYPYATVIEPYGSELVKLSVKADKSSYHKFYITIDNGNGLVIRSKNIHFHHFYPSH